MLDMGFVGYVECKRCECYIYINSSLDIEIFYHPDDPGALAKYRCPKCEDVIESRISGDHMLNFRSRGVQIRDYNDLFAEHPLTEDAIKEWDIDAEYKAFSGF